MQRILCALVFVCVPLTAGAQSRSADDAAVRKVIVEHYFKAHSTGTGAPLRGTFVDDGRMMWVQDGQLRVRTSGDYIGGFRGTPAPDEAQRKRRIVMVDVTGDAAVAKIELDHPDAVLTDYFSLLRVGGDWKIVNKIYNRRPKAAR